MFRTTSRRQAIRPVPSSCPSLLLLSLPHLILTPQHPFPCLRMQVTESHHSESNTDMLPQDVYVASILLFEVGNVICGAAQTSAIFIGGRTVAGLGAAGLFSGGLVMLTAASPPNWRAPLIGGGMGLMVVGGALGPLIGGALTQHLGWRWCKSDCNCSLPYCQRCFLAHTLLTARHQHGLPSSITGMWIFLPPGGISAFVFLFLRVPEQRNKAPAKEVLPTLPKAMDLVGFALFAPAVIMLLLAFSWGGGRYAWSSATIIGLICGGFAMTGVFSAWAWHRQDKALIPPSIFRKKVVFCGCAVAFLQVGAFATVGDYLPLWFQSVKGATPTSSGLNILPTMITQLLATGFCALCCEFLLSFSLPLTPYSHLTPASYSQQARLRPSLGANRQRPRGLGLGSHDHLQPFDANRPVDWLSDPGRYWAGFCDPDPAYCTAEHTPK